MEGEEEKGKMKLMLQPRRRGRLIVRLGEFLVSHNILVSVVCCAVGTVVLLLLPLLAKNTYISENALMPGSANPTFSVQQTQEGTRLINAIINQKSHGETPRLLAHYMSELGAEVYYHKFHRGMSWFNPLHFFSSIPDTGFVHGNRSFTTMAINTVGIIRAPRGDGKECIVIVTPYNSQKIKLSETVSLGLAYSVFSLLSQATWLAKDIVWVAADARYGEHASVASWLRDYHNPIFLDASEKASINIDDLCMEGKTSGNCKRYADNGSISDTFRRAGTMAAGLVIKVVDKKEGNEMDSISIYSEASNGQMPNLDLINIVHYLAVHRQAFHLKIGRIDSLLNSVCLKTIGKTLEWLSKMAGSLNSKWNFGIPAADYVEGTATLASSMYTQALGIPTGPHGAFRDYQIDAITLEFSARISLQRDLGQSTILVRGSRLIEGVIRSVNNLLEKFHQSFFLYFLTSPNKFVSVGVYMIAFALLATPLPIVAAALFSVDCNSEDLIGSSEQNPAPASEGAGDAAVSWQWIHAARMVFVVHLWAVIVSLMPYVISHIPDTTPRNGSLVWMSFSIITLSLFYMTFGTPYGGSQRNEWLLLKALMIAAASIGLSLMSIINFATAQMGSILLVPMCLMAQPVRRCKLFIVTVCNLFLGVLGFPPAAMLILKGMQKGFGEVCIGDFWVWTKALWEWNSATYLYLLIIHLPCWVLFMHVLLHP